MVNEEQEVVGAIDWEFTYAASVEFSHSPPWWLLLERPERWKSGFDDWVLQFDARLPSFLKVLRELEQDAIACGRMDGAARLSDAMQRNWNNGVFWITYAAQHSWIFDKIYWGKIDRRFFGEGDLEDRFALLTQQEKDEYGVLLERKLKEMEPPLMLVDTDTEGKETITTSDVIEAREKERWAAQERLEEARRQARLKREAEGEATTGFDVIFGDLN